MPTVEYAVAAPSDSTEVVDLLANVFSESDPPTVAIGLSYGEMKQFLDEVVPALIPAGLTIIARCGETTRLAGVMLSDDFALLPDLDAGQISPKLQPILSMLETLDEQFRREQTIAPGQFLHLFMLGVDRQFAGRGLAQGLVKACLESALQKGYRTALTEATGQVSQHIFRKSGFTDRFRASYQDFRYQNQPVFASIREHQAAILMEKVLS